MTIQVTSIDKQGNTVSLTANTPQKAEQLAKQLSETARFIRIVEQGWTLVFPAGVRVAQGRLAHIIQHHANVVLQ